MSEKVTTIDAESLEKIIAMRARGRKAVFNWGDPSQVLSKYPSLAGTL